MKTKSILIIILSIFMALPMKAQTTVDVKSLTPTDWNGGKKYDFKIDGRDAIMVVPDSVAYGTPWIWRPAFFGAFPSADIALLKQGWHIGYYDVTHLYGSPRAVSLSKDFYDAVVPAFGLAKRGVVEGVSRGGLIAIAYAAQYPETVSSLYLDAPVCDLTSWPGRKSNLWPDVLAEWGVKDEEITSDFRGNAVAHLQALADAHVPIIAVCGGKDKVVPYLENMDVVRKKYQEMGGVVEVIVKPDCDHHPHGLEDPEPVVDFVTRYADGYKDFQSINLRGDMKNSFTKMAVEKKATVAFLGGSITEMKGWRNMIEEDLKQRFPDTDFTFIDAGIGSLGSTPHAFRFEKDVLAKGTPDLLFVEAAVNDHTNDFGPREQILGMEGIFRHALNANPYMDIILLDFIYEPFIPILASGETPEVILNHEKVAEHYNMNSINLAQEISDRMKAGILTWEQFGGTHPAWLGHKFYAAAINRVLDANAMPYSEYQLTAHTVPEPIDKYCYANGKMISAASPAEGRMLIKKVKGFVPVKDWTPIKKAGTRPGFVNVPMLSTDNGGTFTLEFEGRAFGLFMVCGPDCGKIDYSFDGGAVKTIDTFTQWSNGLYIPWVWMLAEDLSSGKHTVTVTVPKENGCHIRNFVVNK